MKLTRHTIGIATVALSVAVATYLRMERVNQRLRDEVMELQKEVQRLSRAVQPTDSRPATATENGELAGHMSEHVELLRLRGEIGVFRRYQAEINQAHAEQAERDSKEAEQLEEKKARIAREQLAGPKMAFARAWWNAFQAFAEDNNGKLPGTFDQARKYVPDPLQAQAFAFLTGDFEIVFHGFLGEIKEPDQTIIFREKSPFNVLPDGRAWRTYQLASGRSLIKIVEDGNFQPWEQGLMDSRQ